MCSGISKTSLFRKTTQALSIPLLLFMACQAQGLHTLDGLAPSLILVLIPYAIKHGKRVLNDLGCLSIKLVNMLLNWWLVAPALAAGSWTGQKHSKTERDNVNNAHSKMKNIFCFSATNVKRLKSKTFGYKLLRIKPNQTVNVNCLLFLHAE